MLMLAVQPPWRAPHRRRVCDGGLRAARAHRQGAAERAPECGAAEQRQAAQGCDGPGACPTRRSPVHAGACTALTTAHGHVSASQVLTTAPALRPPGALGQCGAARCARGGRARHALDHLRPGVISCRCRGTRARAGKYSPRRPVPPLPTGDLVPVPRHARGHPRRVHRFAWARSPRAPVLL